MRVRRRSANPKTLDPRRLFGTALLGWYDASRLGTAYAEAAPVSQWNDLSSYGRHVAQASSALQPTYRGFGLYGMPAVRCDGGDLLTHASTPFHGLTEAAFFSVWSASAAKNSGYLWAQPNTSGTNGFDARTTTASSSRQCNSFVKTNTATSDLAIGVTSDGSLAYSDSKPNFLEAEVNLARSSLDHVGWGTYSGLGMATVAGATIVAPLGEFNIGGFSSGFTALGFLGDLHELIFLNRVPTSGERLRVRRYLRAKWGARLPTYAGTEG